MNMHPGSKKRPSSPSSYVPSSTSQTWNKLQGSSKPFLDPNRRLRVHVIQAKLDNKQLSEIFSAIDSRRRSAEFRLERCAEAQGADVIITAIRMRKRLERHIDWDLTKCKAIVTPQWLFDSTKECKPLPYDDYAALEEISEEIAQNVPDPGDPRPSGSGQLSHTQQSLKPTHINVSRTPPPTPHTLSYKAPLSCCRAHPLICPNQELVSELDIIKKCRWLEGEDISALSYARAIATLKAYPFRITKRLLWEEVSDLPFIGPKTATLIEEFLTYGRLSQSETIKKSERFQSLTAFTSIHGIGPTTAKSLYASGMRTLEHLEEYYWSGPEEGDFGIPLQDEEEPEPQSKHDNLNMTINVALKLRSDLAQKIPREEAEEIHRVVMSELEHVQAGCLSTIVGGYRRGKQMCDDVDIVFTHPELHIGSGEVKGFSKKLTRRLIEKGLVSYVMQLSSFHKSNALRTTHWDSLEKALTVFTLPATPSRPRCINRRLDLIFAPHEVYWTAIVGWTGSIMFQRDLRRWAKNRGMKFDSAGITRRYDSKGYYPTSEKGVFDVFGLEWVHPTLRNADA